jgi:hypothetical protein
MMLHRSRKEDLAVLWQCGSADHARSTAALYSIVAFARLYNVDPEDYLRCLIRLVPRWPNDRMRALSPLFRARTTRTRVDPGPVEPLDIDRHDVAGAGGAELIAWPSHHRACIAPRGAATRLREADTARAVARRGAARSIARSLLANEAR